MFSRAFFDGTPTGVRTPDTLIKRYKQNGYFSTLIGFGKAGGNTHRFIFFATSITSS